MAAGEGAQALLRLLWAAPYPALLLDAQWRIVDANDAFVQFAGFAREALAGRDVVGLQPAEDQAAERALRRGWSQQLAAGPLALADRRLVDSAGLERWFRQTLMPLPETGQVVAVLQDTTGEHAARAQAERTLVELAQWFDLSPAGMLVFDGAGLIVRSNRAFEALVGRVPVLLAEAEPDLQALLAWEGGAPHPALQPGAPPLETQALLAMPEGRRRLSARVSAFATDSGQRRYMAVVEDRSAEEERDLAQLEIGALMDTAGIFVATYDASRGWLRSAGAARGTAAPGGSALQGIAREIVDPASLPEYEKLQAALRAGQRAEVRYAVNHPELGQRWLLTRVEPGALGPGRRATSVVTLDVTDRERAQRRNEQLLRELELMFGLSEVGIVWQRGARIERANQAMAELTGWSAPELTALDPALLHASARDCVEFERELAEGLKREGRYRGERRLRRRDGTLIWVQVAARPVDPAQPDAGMVCSFVDVDERHRARESLQRQAERTRAVLDSVLVGIVTVADGGIEWMNRSARRMFGGELADFVGEPIAIVATPEADHPLRRSDWTGRLAEGQSETFECRLRGRDGREFWVVGNVVLTSGQLTFALLDIERRREAEISIARARASLQRVIETAPLAIALLDGATRRVLQANQTATDFLALPPPGLAAALDEAPRRLELHQRETDRLWDTRIVTLPETSGAPPQLLLVASDVTEQRAADEKRLQAAIAQREVLVKEVHHRIKNNLQGVAGLLQQYAARHPDVQVVLQEAVSQVQAIAQVYGLQVGAAGPLRLARVVAAIAQSVARTFGRTISAEAGPGAEAFILPETESIPVALVVNELLTNAVKHGRGDAVACRVLVEDGGARIELRHRGRLPEGFDLARFPGGVSGLGLVRALLPRRSALLSLDQEGGEVVTRVRLNPPSVRVSESATMPG
ncbi:MAG: PAS domain S-box protein [Rubrivivax sp.]